MANPPLTTAEVQELKYWHGYPNVLVTALPYIQGARVFEDIIATNLDDFALGQVRTTILVNLRAIEQTAIPDARSRYQVLRLEGEVTLNPEEYGKLQTELRYWRRKLSQITGIPLAEDVGWPTAAGHGGSGSQILL